MNDFNLITVAVAAASSFGFLAALGIALLLLNVCAGLYARARRLQGEFNRANDLKQEFQNKYLVVCREKAALTFERANLRGQVSDLLLQRRALGFALFDAVDEIDALESELRSTRRRLAAAVAMGKRLCEELLIERVKNKFITLTSADAHLITGAKIRNLGEKKVNVSTIIVHNEGSRTIIPILAPTQFTVSIGDTRPAPYGLMVRTIGTRAEVRWRRNATDNTGVEYCLNDGPWRPLIDDTNSLSFILPKGTTHYIRVRNTWIAGTPHSPSSSITISMPKAA